MTIATPPNVKVVRDNINRTLTFTFTGLSTGDGKTVTVITPAIAFNYENGCIAIPRTDLSATSAAIDSFKFFGDGNWMNISFTMGDYEYVINSRYTLKNSSVEQSGILYKGKASIVTDASKEPFENENMEYFVIMGSTTADLYIFNASFAEAMPPQNILISGIPYVMTAQNYILSSTNTIIPSIDKVPYPNFEINDFVATIPFTGKGGSMEFLCGPQDWSVDVSNLTLDNGIKN